MKHPSALGLSIALACALCVPCFAGEVPATSAVPKEPSQPAPSLPEQLGRPAQQEAVGEHVARAMSAGVDEAKEVAAALRFAGGIHATEGLCTLTRHRELAVRVAALEGLAGVRVRSRQAVERVRRATRAFHEEERCAAIRALGSLGAGSDMEALIELAAGRSPAVRLAAFSAMTALSGESVATSVSRWAYWWKRKSKDLTPRILEALDALEADPGAPTAGQCLALLRAHGWVALGEVQHAVRDWLRAPQSTLRIHACHLAGHHRLADATRELVWVGERGSEREQVHARRALLVLGVQAEADLTGQ